MKYNFLQTISNFRFQILSGFFFLTVPAFIIINCSEKVAGDQVVLAKIGDEIITVNDFRRDYEFGLPHLKKRPDKKRSYLDFMIREKILSMEGYRSGLDDSDRVKKLEDKLLSELMVEELFKKEVHEKIDVTDDEIQQAIKKSNVSWKLRYWVESSADRGEQIVEAMRQSGYSEIVDNILNRNPEIKLEQKDFETDYLTWLDVPADLLEAIKDLPVGEISNPVEMNGVFFIFQIVDIRRQGLTENDLQSKAERFRQILFYRKVLAEAKHFMVDFMTPKNVVTKGVAFRTLSQALIEWKQIVPADRRNFITSVKNAEKKQSALYALRESLGEVLVTFQDGNWIISDFLERFNPVLLKTDIKNIDQFRGELNLQIALEMRNYFMIAEARRRGLQNVPSLKKDLDIWRNKWVYQETRSLVLKNLQVNETQALEYFARYKNRYKLRWNDKPVFAEFRLQAKRDAYIQKAKALLDLKIDSLKTLYPVYINQAVLDTINTIDSKKSRWMSLQVFKGSSNRPAFPIVDPAWGF